jgi:hypothetical protein
LPAEQNAESLAIRAGVHIARNARAYTVIHPRDRGLRGTVVELIGEHVLQRRPVQPQLQLPLVDRLFALNR